VLESVEPEGSSLIPQPTDVPERPHVRGYVGAGVEVVIVSDEKSTIPFSSQPGAPALNSGNRGSVHDYPIPTVETTTYAMRRARPCCSHCRCRSRCRWLE
jgi:hypothetical protein